MVLSTIMGYQIEFDNKPYQKHIPAPKKFNAQEHQLIQEEISNLLAKGAIDLSVHEPNEFISNVFLVKKKNGKF